MQALQAVRKLEKNATSPANINTTPVQGTTEATSPKNLKRVAKGKAPVGASANSNLNYLYSQLNSLLAKRESTATGPQFKDKHTPKNNSITKLAK